MKLAFVPLLFIFSISALANSECPTEQPVQIDTIEVTGNRRTSVEVIKQEFGLTVGQRTCHDEIRNRIERVLRTGLFVTVDYRLIPGERSSATKIEVSVEEKWTTIPIAKFNSGGGVTQYTLGVYDPNVFGQFLEAGLQYENLAGTDSGVMWFKNPRLFGQKHGLDLQYWNTKRIRIKYDQTADDPVVKNGFIHEREKIYADYFRDIKPGITARLSLDYNKDKFSSRLLPTSVLDKVGASPVLPPATELLIARIGLDLGEVSGEVQSLRGRTFNLYWSYAEPLAAGSRPFQNVDLKFFLFQPINRRLLYAQRLLGGTTSTQAVQYWYYLGGLDRIRGYADSRFAGDKFALSNSELRYLIAQNPNQIFQGTLFMDLAAIGDDFKDLDEFGAASSGVGLRATLPKLYRFIVRLDYAVPLEKNDYANWSFGVQNFF